MYYCSKQSKIIRNDHAHCTGLKQCDELKNRLLITVADLFGILITSIRTELATTKALLSLAVFFFSLLAVRAVLI